MALFEAIVATIIVSLISLIGVISIAINKKILDKITNFLIAFAAGGLLGGAFFHLIPESLEVIENVFVWVIGGFLLFFVIERFLKWRHCHDKTCEIHTVTYMSLIGDAIHNFIDGLIIAASFVVGFQTGITTTLAVILHEIPQEIGDFGILVYGGFSRSKALLYNFLTAITAILGAIIGIILIGINEMIASILLPIAAGGFIYISASDLIPELHKEPDIKKGIFYSISFILGLALMYTFTLI